MTITPIPLGPVNCYLVRTANDLFLIDSGTDGTGSRLISGIAAAGEDPSTIKLLILTHGHSDHAGNAAWLQREYGILVAIHRADAEYIRTASNEIPPGTSALARIVGAIFARAARKNTWQAVNPDHLLDRTTDLKAFGLEAALLEFPGYTPGSIGLLLPQGNLIAGDLVSNFRKPGIGLFAFDLERMKQDIWSLVGLGVRMIYPGHGKPFAVDALPL